MTPRAGAGKCAQLGAPSKPVHASHPRPRSCRARTQTTHNCTLEREATANVDLRSTIMRLARISNGTVVTPRGKHAGRRAPASATLFPFCVTQLCPQPDSHRTPLLLRFARQWAPSHVPRPLRELSGYGWFARTEQCSATIGVFFENAQTAPSRRASHEAIS